MVIYMKAVRITTCAVIGAVVIIMIIYAVITGSSYLDIHASVKNSIESVFSTLRGDSYIRQAHFEYLRATRRGHFNQVTFLTDGRMMTDNLEPNIFLYERANAFSQLRDYLERDGVPFLYVRVPSKIEDNSLIPLAFSDNQIIRNADRLLELIRAEGIDTLDLRAEMMRENMDFAESFYRMDIHWTTETSLWASERIGEHLISEYGFEIDKSVWDYRRYESITFKNAWQGNEARYSNARRTFEDITVLFPSFETEIMMTNRAHEILREGCFIDVFTPKIRDENIEHLGFLDIGLIGDNFSHIFNFNSTNDKKVLLIADSFGLTKATFFVLGFERLDSLYLVNRYTSPVLWDAIDENDYDIVILAVSDDVVSMEQRELFEDDRLFLGYPGR